MSKDMGHRVGTFRLDPSVRAWLVNAQADADSRGAKYVVSGLILGAAASAGDQFAERLLDLLHLELDQLRSAIDEEWDRVPPSHQDEPIAAISDTIARSVSQLPSADSLVTQEMFLASLISFDDAMAARVIRRVGQNPAEVARRLLAHPGGQSEA
jgi:ATP-dependent Clp protease ATP-binding subunit ClpA